MFNAPGNRSDRKVAISGKKAKPPSKVGASSSNRAAVTRDEQIANDLAIARLIREDESVKARARRAQEATDAALAAWTSRT
jgi:hypothetical protein